jgi:DNA-binding NarL/FixJ family response regulator
MLAQTINIAIIDDHSLFRNGLAGLLSEFSELHILFQAKSGIHLQELIIQHFPLPDVVLMDINMPEMDGYKATKWLKSTYPAIRVVALSMYDDDKAVIDMIRSGATGYILKDARPIELLHAIQAVYQKGIYLNEMVSGMRLHDALKTEPSPFSERELEFLKYCCTELTYKEIADRMFLSVRTIDNYRDALLKKLDLKSRTGLVLYCIQYKIVTL